MLNSVRVLLTGAGGFIGSHLAEGLVRAGAHVTCMIHYNSTASQGNLIHLPHNLRVALNIATGDISDCDFVLRAMEGHDVVLHLAALIGIPYSYVAPRSYLRTNIEGTLNILECARRLGVKRIVHTSTSEVYGTAVYEPIDERHPLQGQSPYSASKIAADKLAESYFRSFRTPVVTLRPFNTYGPRQSARAIIPTIISQALKQDRINLGSLGPVRDMTYVADTVDGFLLAATVPKLEGETINLGTGDAHSIRGLAEYILQLMGKNTPIMHDAVRDRPTDSEVMKLVSDNSRAKRLLGWTPQVSIGDGLRQTIAFVKEHPQLFHESGYVL